MAKRRLNTNPLRRIVGAFSINALTEGAVLECGHRSYRSWNRRREARRRCDQCGKNARAGTPTAGRGTPNPSEDNR